MGEGVGSFRRPEPRLSPAPSPFGNSSLCFSSSNILHSTPLRLSYDSAIAMLQQFPAPRNPISTSKDQELIQIVDSALADATRRAGHWLLCRPGCTQCCIGVFSINQLDALRLRRGLAELVIREPERAQRVRDRAKESAARLVGDFPGDSATGVLEGGDAGSQRFSEFANDEPCPALDPATGTCDLYESRPMTCRGFGPPVRSEDGLGVCELCFQGASDEEIAACEMKPDPDDLESPLLEELEKSTGARGETIVAFCLAGAPILNSA